MTSSKLECTNEKINLTGDNLIAECSKAWFKVEEENEKKMYFILYSFEIWKHNLPKRIALVNVSDLAPYFMVKLSVYV